MQKVDFEVQLPETEIVSNLPIQEEFFWLSQNRKKQKLRLHDYAQIYQTPHLYEYLMQKLQAKSHIVLSSLLIDRVTQAGGNVKDLVVLEIGAGSGMVGKALADLGVKSISGIDILPEAAEAAKRECPGVYENYYVEDLTNLSEKTRDTLSRRGFNCLVCASALAFNHIPASGLASGFNLIAPNGWIAFNVQKERWEDKGETSFVASHPWVAETDIFEIVQRHNYQHRFHMDGRPLYYMAIIGTKRANIPRS
ncbi:MULTISPECIES: class I SAM-dependent DNA methyltransferase [Aerosakkonema]|uniref:class I SAM-dependent DNA methyltransferase n=1 Tax=Aerosakkonema TaxID=1246629 RepID=UPI0035B9141D